MENIEKLKSIIEALLVVSEGGLSREDIKRAVTDADGRDIEEGVRLLREEYEGSNRSFNIAEIAGRYRIVTKPEYMPWIGNLYQKEPDRLKGASLETLAILAYKQPVTRTEIESVRGVNVGGVLKTLLEKGLIEVRGRKEAVGKPLIYGTTEKFLELFGLNSLNDLPALREFSEEDLEYGKPGELIPVEGEEEESAANGPQSAGDETEGESEDMSQVEESTDDSAQSAEGEPITEETEYESEKSE